jgi:ABC-type glutathione transport system ATPase component
LARRQGSKGDPSLTEDQETVRNRLLNLAKLAPRFEEFGLTAPLDYDELLGLLDSIEADDRQQLARSILTPYLQNLEARYEGLLVAERVLRRVVPTINSFLEDKFVVFTPRDGLRVETEEGHIISPGRLSSGERQLMMLLCTTLVATQTTRLFIIDEPELSLGVRWQRKILDALLTVATESPLQFLVATHSIEIMSGHHESLVQLQHVGADA